MPRRRPGQVRDAIVQVLERSPRGAAVAEVCSQVSQLIGEAVPPSSVRSYLRLNTPELFARSERGQYVLAGFAVDEPFETMGEKLSLPPFLEPRRAQIEAGLRPID